MRPNVDKFFKLNYFFSVWCASILPSSTTVWKSSLPLIFEVFLVSYANPWRYSKWHTSKAAEERKSYWKIMFLFSLRYSWFTVFQVYSKVTQLHTHTHTHTHTFPLCAQMLSCVRLWDPMNCSPPDFSVYGFFQARILEWVAMLSSKDSS